jgi:non-canonical poly(A) RNA polymerase PAPD5/7
MIIAFLREFKRNKIQKQGISSLEEVLLSEYLLEFLNFYGNRFNINDEEIDMIQGGTIKKKRDRNNLGFSVKYTDKNDVNIGAQAFKIRDVFACFRNRYNYIKNYNFKNDESVLKYLVNPSDQCFESYYKKV